MTVRVPVGCFAREPSGDVVYARSDQNVQRWDGLLATFVDAGLTAPSGTPALTSSDVGAITGSIYCCVRYLDAAGRVSNVSTISAVHTIAIVTKTITDATNADPIVITSASHGLLDGATVRITGVRGNYAANAEWVVANKATHTFELTDSQGKGIYTGGGTITQGARDIDYSSIPDISGDSRVTVKQILRTKDSAGINSANAFYIDMDTDNDSGFNLNSTTALSTKTDANLGDRVNLIDENGKDLNLTRHGEPPAWKQVVLHHRDRMWYMVDRPHKEGAVILTNASATVTGIGTNWTSEMKNWTFYPRGASNTVSYSITSINVGAQTMVIGAVYAGTTDPYAQYQISKSGKSALTMFFSEPARPYSIDQLKGITVTSEPGTGVWTGGISLGNWLFLLFEHRIYRFSYSTFPSLDGQSLPAHHRGCVNQQTHQIVEGTAYLMDRKGIYTYTGTSDEPVSIPIQTIFENKENQLFQIRWSGEEHFFSEHDPTEETIRWFLSLDGNYYPRHAIAYHYRSRRWWIEEFPFAFTASTLGKMGGYSQVFGGASAQRVFAKNIGSSDGVPKIDGPLRGAVTSATSYSVSATGMDFSASMVGYPVMIVEGKGVGQKRIITAQTATKLTLKSSWQILPDTTSVVQIGGFTWTWKSGFYDFLQTNSDEKRSMEIEYKSTAGASRLEVRRFTDDPDTGEMVAMTDYVTKSGTKQNGISTVEGRDYRTISTTRTSGHCESTFDGTRGSRADGKRQIQLELTGTPNEERQTIRQVTLNGATGVG